MFSQVKPTLMDRGDCLGDVRVLVLMGLTPVKERLPAYPGVAGSAWVCLVVAVLTFIVASGIQRSSRANAVIVSATLIGLAVFVVGGANSAAQGAICG